MAQTESKGTFQPDSDAHITFEDQQKINRFAKLNAKLEELKEDIKVKENDLQTLEDACDEISLFDDDEKIPYLFGEVFIYQNLETTQKCLEEAKNNIQSEIKECKSKSAEIEEAMSDLKSHLYGKFGSHINLEADD